jgi:starch synthase (maltosyl-transferring)
VGDLAPLGPPARTGIERVVIGGVRPTTPDRASPAKATVGRTVVVSADIYADGHDVLAARVCWRPGDGAETTADEAWNAAPMTLVSNDRWEGTWLPAELGAHQFVVRAWVDSWATWAQRVTAKVAAGQDVANELEDGALILEAAARASEAGKAHGDAGKAHGDAGKAHGDAGRANKDAGGANKDAGRADKAAGRANRDAVKALRAGDPGPASDDELARRMAAVPLGVVTSARAQAVWVDRERAAVGAWYELFPRSYGGLRGAAGRLADVAAMGFDVVYLPPIHPIGVTARKGPGNTPVSGIGDPGSPWAIGSSAGGHDTVDPGLGTVDDFDAFVAEAGLYGMEVALDLAWQCSPDHPWVHAHPEWFLHRADGTIRYAENPPKRYQDIYPLDFLPPEDRDRLALWSACRDVVEYWLGHGVRIFRVDNPHTKPFAFWEWLIADVRSRHPDVVWLAEAFTRPRVMEHLAELGFSQSYTYFTWRVTRDELATYADELAHGPVSDYFRPSFWPNTPDILSGPLRRGGPGAFKMRAVLAATLSPSWGVYSGYELSENQPASEENEEYACSEKYEIPVRSWNSESNYNIAPYLTMLNDIRRRHPALADLRSLRIHGATDDALLVFSKQSGGDTVLVVVNVDPGAPHGGTLQLDLPAIGLPLDAEMAASDEITMVTFPWRGPNPYVHLTPDNPAHIIDLGLRQ